MAQSKAELDQQLSDVLGFNSEVDFLVAGKIILGPEIEIQRLKCRQAIDEFFEGFFRSLRRQSKAKLNLRLWSYCLGPH